MEREGAAKRKKKKKELLNFCFQVFGFFFPFLSFLFFCSATSRIHSLSHSLNNSSFYLLLFCCSSSASVFREEEGETEDSFCKILLRLLCAVFRGEKKTRKLERPSPAPLLLPAPLFQPPFNAPPLYRSPHSKSSRRRKNHLQTVCQANERLSFFHRKSLSLFSPQCCVIESDLSPTAHREEVHSHNSSAPSKCLTPSPKKTTGSQKNEKTK